MQKFSKTQVVLLVVVAVIGVALVGWRGMKEKFTTPTSPAVQNQNWKTYTNTSYGYSVSYPPEANIIPRSEEDPTPIEKNDDLYFGIPGTGTSFSVMVILPYKNALKDLASKRSGLVDAPLDAFAEMLYRYQAENTNPYTKDKKIGALETTTFTGHKAYTFTSTKGLEWAGLSLGSPVGNGQTHRFVFIANLAGQKMIIQYPTDDVVAEQMKDSFKFVGQ